MTAVREGTPTYCAKRRFTRHVSRAFRDGLNWPLCKAIRKHGADAFDIVIVSKVRGKTAAHELERALIKKYRPKLNGDI